MPTNKPNTGPKITDYIILAAIGSSNSTTWDDFKKALALYRPADDDKDSWIMVRNLIRLLEQNSYVAVEWAEGERPFPVTIRLTELGVNRMKRTLDDDQRREMLDGLRGD